MQMIDASMAEKIVFGGGSDMFSNDDTYRIVTYLTTAIIDKGLDPILPQENILKCDTLQVF